MQKQNPARLQLEHLGHFQRSRLVMAELQLLAEIEVDEGAATGKKIKILSH